MILNLDAIPNPLKDLVKRVRDIAQRGNCGSICAIHTQHDSNVYSVKSNFNSLSNTGYYEQQSGSLPQQLYIQTVIPDSLASAVIERYYRTGAPGFLTLPDDRQICVSDPLSELDASASEPAAVTSAYFWLNDVDSMEADYRAVEHGLQHYVGRCTCTGAGGSTSQSQSPDLCTLTFCHRGDNFIADEQQPEMPCAAAAPESSADLAHSSGFYTHTDAEQHVNAYTSLAQTSVPYPDSLDSYLDASSYGLPESTSASLSSQLQSSPSSSLSSLTSASTPYSQSSDLPDADVGSANGLTKPDLSTLSFLDCEYEIVDKILFSPPCCPILLDSGMPTSQLNDPYYVEAHYNMAASVVDTSAMPMSIGLQSWEERYDPIIHAQDIQRAKLRERKTSIASTFVVPLISHTARARQAKMEASTRPAPYSASQRGQKRKASHDDDEWEPESHKTTKRPRAVPSSHLSDLDDDDCDDDCHIRKKRKGTKTRSLKKQDKARRKKRRNSPKRVGKVPCGFRYLGCEKCLSRESDRLRHIFRHCKWQPLKIVPLNCLCRDCGRKLSRKDSLKRHIKHVHKQPEGVFPEGHIEALLAGGRTDYAALLRVEIDEALAKYEATTPPEQRLSAEEIAQILDEEYDANEEEED